MTIEIQKGFLENVETNEGKEVVASYIEYFSDDEEG